MKKQKIIKKILFLLQEVKFEEIKKNCSYVIIYKQFFLIFQT